MKQTAKILLTLICLLSIVVSVASCGIFGGGSGGHGAGDVSGDVTPGDGDYIVSGTDGLKYELNADGASYTVIGMEEYVNANNIVIPEKYNGLPVTAIGEKAFYKSKKIMSVDLPDTITSIGENAFNSCTRLMTMEIPKSMTDGSVARGCSTLSSDDSCIGDDAFAGCENLVEVVNNSDLEIVAGSEDYGQVALNAIEVHDGESKITHVGDYRFYSFAGKNYLVSYYGNDTNLVLPESFNGESYIVNDAVFCFRDNITSVVIPDSVTAIGDYAFNYCLNLKSITFGKNVESIGEWAFNMCEKIESVYISNIAAWCNIDWNQPILGNGAQLYLKDGASSSLITNLVIPDGVTKISDDSFHGCESITSVTIPDSVTSIGERAFMMCDNISSINFGEGVQSIGMAAFYGCNFTSLVIPDSVTVISGGAFNWCQSLESVEFGNSVTEIGSGAFEYCISLTSVVIPDSVTTLGDWAFYKCDGLTSVVIGDGMTSIGYKAFEDCENLKSVVIGDGVTEIGDSAFYFCLGLESLVIGESVTSIGENAFGRCDSLTSIYISDLAAWCNIDFYDISSAPQYQYNNDGVHLYLKDGEGSTLITDLVIPEGVTEIKTAAFAGFNDIVSVVIPSSVTSIGGDAFFLCENIASVYISDLAAWCNIDFIDNPLLWGGKLYLKDGNTDTLITNLVIPEGITEIKDNAFSGCTSLQSVVIPGSVTRIGNAAFADCENLSSIVIPDSVTSIGERAFEDCKNLSSIVIPDSVTSIGSMAFARCYDLTSVAIPDSVTVIDAQAFWACENIASLTIGKGLASIGENAFWGCDNLASITVDTANTLYKSIDGNLYKVNSDGTTLTLIKYASGKTDTTFTTPLGVTAIASGAFNSCRKLESVVFSDSVTSISKDAFYYCQHLRSIVIGKGVTYIDGAAIDSCTQLSSITVDDANPAYKSIDGVLFKKNADSTLTLILYVSELTGDLVTYTIPDGVSAIGDYAFLNSGWRIQHLIIGDSVITIGTGAFSGCNNLESVVIGNGVTTIGDEAFYDSYNLESVVLGNSVTTIGDSAFMHCGKLASITIPDSVTTIGEYAFYACSSLTSLVTGKGLTSIGKFAFADCSGLTSVTLYGNGASIGEAAFYYCTALTTLVIGEGVTSIGESAFSSCTNLENVTIGKDVTSMARAAFLYCEVKNVYITDLVAWCNIDFENNEFDGVKLYLKDGEESTLITTLVIGDGVRLGQYNFSGCSSITGVVISLGAVYESNAEVFGNCSNLTSIYYCGSWNDWAMNGMFPILNGTNAFVYYYSENQPTEEGSFWHYDANGNVAVWPGSTPNNQKK